MAAPLITSTKPRYCGFAHGACDCPTPPVQPHSDLIRVWTGDEWEWTACTCPVCADRERVA